MTKGATVADVTNDTQGEGVARYEELAREFGRRLREARESRWPRPRQRDWAEAMGLTDVRQYQRWEHGEQLPSLERLPLILEVSGIDVTDLFDAPGTQTRDDIREHIDRVADELSSKIEANFFSVITAIAELRAYVEERLPEQS